MPIFKKEKNPADAPLPGVIILGCPRSGTTLLRRLLAAHPAISCPGETFLLRGCARMLEHDMISAGHSYGVEGALEGLGFTADEISARLRAFVAGFYEDITRRERRKMWVAKTAVDSFYIPAIEKIFGGSVKYVCMTRHGLDVVCSLDEFTRDLQTYIAELHKYIARWPQPYLAFAHAWADVTTDILDFATRNKSCAHLLRYEDLIAAPDAELAKITAFLGIEKHMQTASDIIEKPQDVGGIGDWKSFKKRAVEDSSTGRWRSDLPAATAQMLAPVVNPVLARAGYDQISMDEDDAARRQEIARMLMQGKSE